MATLKIKWIGLALLFAFSSVAEPLREFQTAEQAKYFQELTHELRCVVCQNQNLAESNAPLAEDLRDVIHTKLLAGETKQSIRQFMVDRYGQFVLYKPPFQLKTILLWIAPFIFLVLGLVYLFQLLTKCRDNLK